MKIINLTSDGINSTNSAFDDGFENDIAIPKEQKRQLLVRFIKEKLQSENVSNNELAGRLNKKPPEVSKWLSGNHNFTLDTLFELEEKIGIKLVNIRDTTKLPETNVRVFKVEPENAELNITGHDALNKVLTHVKSLKNNPVRTINVLNSKLVSR